MGLYLSMLELLFAKVTLLDLMKHKMLILFRLIKNLHTKRASPSILPRNPFLPALLNLYTLFQILPCHENIRLVNALLRRLTILSIEILRVIEIFVFSV